MLPIGRVIGHKGLATGSPSPLIPAPLLSLTFATTPRTRAFNSRVLRGELVVALAMGLPSMSRTEPLPAHHVLVWRDRFQMLWSDTSPHPAKVVEVQSRRDRAIGKFVGEPVCRHLTSVDAEQAVALAWGQDRFRSGPGPARLGLVDERPEPLLRGPGGPRFRVKPVTESAPVPANVVARLVVRAAHALRERRPVARVDFASIGWSVAPVFDDRGVPMAAHPQIVPIAHRLLRVLHRLLTAFNLTHGSILQHWRWCQCLSTSIV